MDKTNFRAVIFGGQQQRTVLLGQCLFRPLISWIGDTLITGGITDVCVVCESEQEPRYKSALPACMNLTFAGPDDTAALDGFISADPCSVLVYTDPVLTTGEVLTMLRNRCAAKDASVTLLGDDDEPSGLFCLPSGRIDASKLFDHEYYSGVKETLRDTDSRVTSVLHSEELYFVQQVMIEAIIYKHIANGVNIMRPESTVISHEAVIGEGTQILPGSIIMGNTVIGIDCVIGPNSQIKNSVIGDNSTVSSSHITDSTVGSGAAIGPFAYIRPDCKLGENVKVGDFVELKNASIGNGTKVPHLSYVGDAEIGSGVNIGCGTITVNYDGFKKHMTKVGDNAFVGCNSNLVSPVTVGEGAYIAAGSTVTHDVPSGALAIARARQTVKEQWADKRRREKSETDKK